MKKVLVVVVLVLIPLQSLAKEQLRKFRTVYKLGESIPLAIAKEELSRQALPGVGELVLKEAQLVGQAKISGSWKQTILTRDGRVIYSAGQITDNIVPITIDLRNAPFEKHPPENSARRFIPGFADAARTFPPTLEVRKNASGRFERYWRFEYLTKEEDRLRFGLISDTGALLETGELPWDNVDGKAMVFPRGPRLSSIEEESLLGLSGDGNINGLYLSVASSLNLNVFSPENIFFYPADDKRFDLPQVYYTIDKAFRWIKTNIGAELPVPVSVRLHVGNGGVSNAAFYHGNTIYLGTGDGVLYRDLLRDPSILIHESIHALVDAYVGLPADGEGGSFNEGFSDLFAALILDNPRMAEASYLMAPYRRTLENNSKAYRDFTSGVYQNGSIVGATFWDMKSFLGTELTAKLAFRTLVRLGKGARFDDFLGALESASTDFLSDANKTAVMKAAQLRGWK